jgi:hypothetical protein
MDERWVAFEDAVSRVVVEMRGAVWVARGGKGWHRKKWREARYRLVKSKGIQWKGQ